MQEDDDKTSRILVEVDEQLKRELKAKLALEGKTLRAWFEERARVYLGEKQ